MAPKNKPSNYSPPNMSPRTAEADNAKPKRPFGARTGFKTEKGKPMTDAQTWFILVGAFIVAVLLVTREF
ncbi:hypothetical protein ACGFZA_15875 [Streptomyces sp. NPDC048211]|uniref:hypothetical protein n=1 Tax=Streptomyces sp. NPDC048211 TaxID=3365516 RepID=UPI00370F7D61